MKLRKVVHGFRSVASKRQERLTFADNRENHDGCRQSKAKAMNKTPKFCISNLDCVKGLRRFPHNFCLPCLSSLCHQRLSLDFVSARNHGWPARIRTWEYWNQNPVGRLTTPLLSRLKLLTFRPLTQVFAFFGSGSLKGVSPAWNRSVVITVSSENGS